LSAWIGKTFAGAFMVIKQSAVELELHSLLKKSSIKESRKLAAKCLAWAFAHPILRVTVYIIEGLEAAKNFALKLGFKNEGCRRCACVQGGIVKDVYVLGMTRQEWRTA
jgi:pantoate kinase